MNSSFLLKNVTDTTSSTYTFTVQGTRVQIAHQFTSAGKESLSTWEESTKLARCGWRFLRNRGYVRVA
jgi:hypothetical protein